MVFLKSVSPVEEASERSRNGASAPIFTASSVLASMNACAPPEGALFADTLRSIEASRVRNMVEDAIPPNADDVNLRDEAARDAHGRVVVRDVRACGDGDHCGV
jgi:hypothetical protein